MKYSWGHIDLLGISGMPIPSNCITWKTLAIVWYGMGYNEPEARFIPAHFLHQPKRFDEGCPFSFHRKDMASTSFQWYGEVVQITWTKLLKMACPERNVRCWDSTSQTFQSILTDLKSLSSAAQCVICVIWE